MFLRAIADENLLPTEELYVLKNAPNSTTERLAESMIQFLSQKAHEDATLLTKEHVEWVMQITGHSFSLRIDDNVHRILETALLIYERWLNPATQLKVITEHCEYFSKKICGHISFVFKTRDISKENPIFAKHVDLCRRVLSIYSRSARSPPHGVRITDWNEYLCRIFLGICCEVMKMSGERAALGNEIEQDLFFCLFDIWTRAQIQNEELWEKLAKLIRTGDWVYRPWFIEGWGLSCSALGRKLMYMLYGGDNGSPLVEIYWPLIGSQSRSVDNSLRGVPLVNQHKRFNFGSSTTLVNIQSTTENKSDDNTYENNNESTVTIHNKTTMGDSDKDGTNAKKIVEVAYMQGQVSLFGQSGSATPTSGSIIGGDVLAMVTAIDVAEPKLLIYLWNEMLNILDLKSISDPDCLAIALAWISYMLDMFSNINISANQRRSGMAPPNGNTVLELFGNKLFMASLKMSGFESAHAISLGGLCRVFCGKPVTAFEDKYLLNFYHTIETFLKNTQEVKEQSRKQVIVHGATLFACGFRGTRSLVDIFLHHIGAIFKHPTKDARLRLCAITMLSSFVCLEWHFWPKESNKSSNQVLKLKTSLAKLSDILFAGLASEENEYNLSNLIWLICTYLQVCAYQISASSRSFPVKLLNLMWDGVGKRSPQYTKTTFEALSSIISLAKYLKRSQTQILTVKWFIEMCAYAGENLSRKKQDYETRRVLALACLKCLLVWVRSDPEILGHSDSSTQLQELIRKSLKVQADTPSAANTPWETAMHSKSMQATLQGRNCVRDIRVTAQCLARELSNDLGSYIGATNRAVQRFGETALDETQIEEYIWSIHRNLSSKEVANWKWNPTDRIRFFSYRRERIFTIIEMPRIEDVSSLLNDNITGNEVDDLRDINSFERNQAELVSPKEVKISPSPSTPRKADTNNDTNNNNTKKFAPSSRNKQNEKTTDDKVTSPTSKSDKSYDFSLKQGPLTPKASSESPNDQELRKKLEAYPWRKPPLSSIEFGDEKELEAYQVRNKKKEENKSRLCDLIILIRDGFGKYAWETTCHYDDLHELAPPIEHVSRGISSRVSKVQQTEDVFAKALEKSQNLATQNKFFQTLHSEVTEIENHEDVEEKDDKLSVRKTRTTQSFSQVRSVATKPTEQPTPHDFQIQIKNKAKSDDAYWSSSFIANNWLFDLKQDKYTNNLIETMRSQQDNETTVVDFYKQLQGKQNTKPNKNNQTNTDIPFVNSIDLYSANKPPSPPLTDEAATFMNGRRLLSTLGLLKYHLPTSARDRDLEILDVDSTGSLDIVGRGLVNDSSNTKSKNTGVTTNTSVENNSNLGVTDGETTSIPKNDLKSMLESLDKIPLLDQIDVAVLVHDIENDKNLPLEEQQISDFDILQTSDLKSHCTEFKYFVNKLCNQVNLDAHTGYNGGITKQDCKRLFYYATNTHEMVFHVPSTMNKADFKRKKEVYLSTAIRIIWTKSKAPIFLSTYFKPSQRFKRPNTPVIYIRLTLLENGLYRVSIHGDMYLDYVQGTRERKFTMDVPKASIASELTGRLIGPEIPITGMSKLVIGPLLDSMVVSESILPHLLRETILNAAHLISEETNECPIYESLLKRQQKILQVSTEFCRFGNTENTDYFKYFFMEPKQIKKQKGQRRSRSVLPQTP